MVIHHRHPLPNYTTNDEHNPIPKSPSSNGSIPSRSNDQTQVTKPANRTIVPGVGSIGRIPPPPRSANLAFYPPLPPGNGAKLKTKTSNISHNDSMDGSSANVSIVTAGGVKPIQGNGSMPLPPPPKLSLPGRPRRRPHPSTVAPGTDPRLLMRHRSRGSSSTNADLSIPSKENNDYPGEAKPESIKTHVPVPLAVMLWYFLGVVSIASSKVLLSNFGVPPMILTMQQLLIGMTLLRGLLWMQSSSAISAPWVSEQGDEKDAVVEKTREKQRMAVLGGLQPVPLEGGNLDQDAAGKGNFKRKSSNAKFAADLQPSRHPGIIPAILLLLFSFVTKQPKLLKENSSNACSGKPTDKNRPKNTSPHLHTQLFLAAIYFALGFLITNYGFQSGSAAFVETVKAAEPITSATTAVAWGIERLGREEVGSLVGIVVGVILSTLGNSGGGSGNNNVPVEKSHSGNSLVVNCVIVMLANICFSFRGLHQKLFRATPQGKPSVVDDLNLQYRMQQIGVLMLIMLIMLTGKFYLLIAKVKYAFGGIGDAGEPSQSFRELVYYLLLALVNGLAFTSYNLASTYILTRISVVHHAALNCIRRVFAIVMTSIVFGLTITFLQGVGIAISVGAFFAYSYFKMKRGRKEKKMEERRKKWGALIMEPTDKV
mmetsp:Transcript_26016/g.51812  ORF Transcript_26016/g.51812 Transcript_26016/m.51812 type:complete len:655 (+) Transcript_26016:27-1991(+)